MCSNICSDELKDLYNIDSQVVSGLKQCRKCTEQASVILRKIDPLCRKCFLLYCTHKFRSTIGKSHQIKPGHKILFAFSGGASSVALLHMIKEGFAQEAHKKFFFQPFLLYIDERPFPGWNETDTQTFHKQVLNSMAASGYPSFVTSITTAFQDSPVYVRVQEGMKFEELFLSLPSLSEKMNDCLKQIESISHKEDLLRQFRWNLITTIANAEKIDRIFSGECSTLLATHLLSDMALGRGAQVASNTAFYDDTKGVPVLRPLREFQSKEIAMYNQFHELQFTVQPTLTTKMPDYTSLQKVTEAFVSELQTNFPATVSTIFRTGDKLAFSQSQSEDSCGLCQSVIDTDLPDSSSIAALRLSEELSKKCHMESGPVKQGCCGSCETGCDSNLDNPNAHILQALCYGCQDIVKRMKSTTFLPPGVISASKQIINRKKMKSDIQDYLLEEPL